MTETKLRIENLTKTFGDEVAVDDLSLTIKQGHLKSLLGPSGCGKTTTLRCIAGLEQPDRGRIYIGDQCVSAPEEDVHLDPRERGIGMVFQSYAVWPHMTVEQNVMFPLRHQKIGTSQERKEKTAEMLEAVGLDPYASNLATNLSGGQQQRVALARALVVEPELLLMDEPLANLDAKLRREMRLEIQKLYEQFDITVLYVTHSQDEALFLSDELAIMNNGKLVEESDPNAIHTDPETYFGMNFMGRCNTLVGKVRSLGEGAAEIATLIGALRSADLMDDIGVNDRVFVCFRPKVCQFVMGGESSGEMGSIVEGTLIREMTTSDLIEYYIDSNDREILVRTAEPQLVDVGDPVTIAIGSCDIKTFTYEEGIDTIENDKVVADQVKGELAGLESEDQLVSAVAKEYQLE